MSLRTASALIQWNQRVGPSHARYPLYSGHGSAFVVTCANLLQPIGYYTDTSRSSKELSASIIHTADMP
jgi:hypothetical protein